MNQLIKQHEGLTVNPLETALKNPTITNLKQVPKRQHTEELAEKACALNPAALGYLSERVKTERLYLQLITRNACAINYVPEKRLTTEFILKAVEANPLCINHIKKGKVTKKIAMKALQSDGRALKGVPPKYLSPELVEQTVARQPFAIRYVPEEMQSKELCDLAFSKNCAVLPFLPAQYITEEMCIQAIRSEDFYLLPDFSVFKKKYGSIEEGPICFQDLPSNMQNDRSVLDAIFDKYPDGARHLLHLNETMANEPFILQKTNKRGEPYALASPKTIRYLKSKSVVPQTETPHYLKADVIQHYVKGKGMLLVPQEQRAERQGLLPKEPNHMCVYDFAAGEEATKIYYVSDLHIEKQIYPAYMNRCRSKRISFSTNAKTNGESIEQIEEKRGILYDLIEEKVEELVSAAKEDSNTKKILLIAGDVADNQELAEMFYDCVRRRWCGIIIAVLGNHELWDGVIPEQAQAEAFRARPIDDIVDDYRTIIDYDDESEFPRFARKTVLLENELFVIYKGEKAAVFSEKEISKATDEDLKELLEESSVIVLGGIGFSGNNLKYNATMGLYGYTIQTRNIEIEKTKQFCKIYHKVNRCAGNKKIIVLTHMPISDWCDTRCNPNWIYINGHTHINTAGRKDNGAIVLADNQIGYEPCKWKLNAFFADFVYDPFEKKADGVFTITSEQYRSFNIGRGIPSRGCNYNGTINALKRNGYYMFILSSASGLRLLSGGSISCLTHTDIAYYYENMEQYSKRLVEAIQPFSQAMRNLSQEIKSFGGVGSIHGCIVDISFYSHIYVNPFDGTITPYFAYDTESRQTFSNVAMLLSLHESADMLSAYYRECEANRIRLLGSENESTMRKQILKPMPEWIMGKEMYQPSKVFRAIQYAWQQNIIRVWNDELIKPDNDKAGIESDERPLLLS